MRRNSWRWSRSLREEENVREKLNREKRGERVMESRERVKKNEKKVGRKSVGKEYEKEKK